jgi:hypothetical protein
VKIHLPKSKCCPKSKVKVMKILPSQKGHIKGLSDKSENCRFVERQKLANVTGKMNQASTVFKIKSMK